jgi:thiamine biosynthesis lipoprotein
VAVSSASTRSARLRVMSCDASVTVVDDRPDARLDASADRLRQLEQRWSRFRDDSEISGLNRAGGDPRRCSGDTVALVEALVRAWHATEGDFDPTLIGTLVELGYAASRDDVELRTSLAPTTAARGRPDLVRTDAATGVVQLPFGTCLDPGGLGKGLAADLVTGELMANGARGALVEIGGDLRVTGAAPDGEAWSIRIDAPIGDEPELVRLADGGVATSTSRLRTWIADGRRRHHLIDPTTLQPTDGDVVACTVIAGTAAWAEAFTKVAFVRGATASLARYESIGLAARVVTADGTVHHTSAWNGFAA